jgi:hypothetical protein
VWHAGLSISQKRKSICALHTSAIEQLAIRAPLEVSTKSEIELGRELSAFNLSVQGSEGRYSVEVLFQGSKVFEEGGPFKDLYMKTPKEAKRDERLRQSGELVRFQFKGEDWQLEPVTAFYDWLYLHALQKNEDLGGLALEYDAFTDIEFNPRRSLNCQARSVALYVALQKAGMLEQAMTRRDRFIEIAFNEARMPQATANSSQGSLFD